MYSAFTSFQLSEDNDSDTEYGINVEGDNISVIPGTMEWHAECTINSAEYTDTEMKIHYTYLKRDPEDGESTINKVATLKPAENNLYRITKIEEDTGAADNLETEAVQETTAAEGESDSVTAAYQAVLEQIAAAQPETEFSEELGEAQYSLEGTPVYTLYDMNQDGTDELIVGQGFTKAVRLGKWFIVCIPVKMMAPDTRQKKSAEPGAITVLFSVLRMEMDCILIIFREELEKKATHGSRFRTEQS